MKILFCTDGSKISFNALKNIAYWIKQATIDTICVIDWNILPAEITIDEENFSFSCANVADTILDYAEEEIKNLGLQLGNRIKNCGSAIESILEQSEKEKYDLILMGSHGKKGIQKWLGSVSQEIINSSKISDYIAKKENNKKKVLFTTDGTECSLSVIGEIISDIELSDKEVHICMVNEDPNLLFLEGTLDTNWLLDIQKQQYMYASNAIESIKKIIESRGIEVNQSTILTGIPAQEIINYAKNNEIDLIILGSRNKSKMDRFLMGSVSKRILENVVSDIWLVRCES
ncbi:universal stress protein UspA-like protein [Clostridium sp. CAG:715]|nr:universal stress protein UspA-like protein [Clostridium sp. CAG:715]